MKNNIYPTHTCFDDALDYLQEIARKHPAALVFEGLKLIHAICLMPSGEKYAHAWVESSAGSAYFFGILDGQRVRVEVDAKEYRADLRVQDLREYTPRQAWEENARHENFGPWIQEFIALCRQKEPA